MSRLGAALGLTAVALLPARAGAATPCEASLALEPRHGFVGQPVLHRRVVVHDPDVEVEWTQPPRFPGFRVETPGTGNAVRSERDGAPAVQIEVPTWIFPVRAGRLTLPPALLRCGEQEIAVESPAFEARPWPAERRPPDFTGVVGAVDVDASAEAEVSLGGSIRVHVTSRGPASLWEAEPRLRVEPAETEIFPRAPRIQVSDGGSEPHVVRHDAFDLVPRRAGPLRIEPVRIPYLDPAGARYRVARTAALEIRVLPTAQLPAAATHAAAGREPGGWRPGVWLGGAALLLAALAAVLEAARRVRAARADPVSAALRAFDRAPDVGARAAALEHALRARLAERGAGPTGRATQAGLERSPDALELECRRALAELERARFGGAGPGLGFDERLEAIRALVVRARSH